MSKPIDRRARIGHVQLTVADLERAVAFYSGVLGFEVTQWIGQSAVFLSSGGVDHIILKMERRSEFGNHLGIGRSGAVVSRSAIRIVLHSPRRCGDCGSTHADRSS